MTDRSVTHTTFVIERAYDAAPARTFAAWSDPALKVRWFMGPEDWESGDYELDFRIGGRERSAGGPPGGEVHIYEARYHDIVPEKRIVYAYDLFLDDTRISVSLATVEFAPEGAGTRLVLTEQAVFLDGYDVPVEREHGTGQLLDALGEELRRQAENA